MATDECIGTEMEARCMKCKQQRPFTVAELTPMKNGTMMARGTCHICQTKMVRILAKPKPPTDDFAEEHGDFEVF